MSNGERMPSPNSPMAVARIIASEHHHPGADHHPTLRHWRGGWMEWTGSHWYERESASLRSELYKRLEGCHYLNTKGEPVSWLPTKPKMANLMEALAAVVHLPESIDPPAWITTQANDRPGQAVACANGILDVATRTLSPATPRYFNEVSVPFDYTDDAAVPTRWLDFLDGIWPGDPASIAALQEWFGYILSGRTDLQKMLMLIGPTRSGKGTIARVLAQLVGNVAGPTLMSLGSDFGLASLLGKPLGIISDARLGRGHHTQVVVERLLSISGEDILDVNRKYREPWTGKLNTRLMLLSNELPQLGDDSGAISGRFVVLTMTRSFLGEEDTSLGRQLAEELPGIFKWALDGLDRLAHEGRFTSPESSEDAARVMRDLVSPISTFVRECCEVGPYAVAVDDIWVAWKTWAEEAGISKSNKQWLGRSLRSTVPSVRTMRARDGGNARSRMYEGIRIAPGLDQVGRTNGGWAAQGSAQGSAQDSTFPQVDGGGPQRSAHFQETTHDEELALEGASSKHKEVVESSADLRGPPLCETCDEPVDNHLPGCHFVAGQQPLYADHEELP